MARKHNSYLSFEAIYARKIIRYLLISRMKRKDPERYQAFLDQQKRKLEEQKYWFI